MRLNGNFILVATVGHLQSYLSEHTYIFTVFFLLGMYSRIGAVNTDAALLECTLEEPIMLFPSFPE